jgi:hypothetical protein
VAISSVQAGQLFGDCAPPTSPVNSRAYFVFVRNFLEHVVLRRRECACKRQSQRDRNRDNDFRFEFQLGVPP